MPTLLKPRSAAESRAAASVVRAAYARISVEELKSGGASIERQLASFRNIDPSMKIFIDDGVSGTKTSRPGFNALLAYVYEEKVTEIVVARVDRLGRNHELKNLLPDLFHKHRCRVLCTEEDSPDLATDMGRLLFDLRCNLACSESDRIGKRVQAGRAKRFDETAYDVPRAGYLLIDGSLVPDDAPRHCPLAQRREVAGAVDEWGIASDAFPGLSNFELAALPVKFALQHRNWSAGVEFAHTHLLLTRSGSWDFGRNAYREAHAKAQMEELCIINGEPKKIFRLIQSVIPAQRCSLYQRAQNPTFYGHYIGRRNWNPDTRPSLNDKRPSYHQIDTDTYEFFYENNHPPLLSEEDYKVVVEMNSEMRADRERGIRPCAGLKVTADGLLDERLKLNELARGISRRSTCAGCQQRMRTRHLVREGQHYYYVFCPHNSCSHYGMNLRVYAALAGISLHLAAHSARVQSGDVPAIQPRPTEISLAREMEEAREALALALCRNPKNRVLSNEVKKIDDQLKLLREGPASGELDMRELKAHQRFVHPRALESEAWLELLQAGSSLALGVLQMIQSIEINYVGGKPALPSPGGRRTHPPAEIVSIKTVDEA